MGTTEALTTSPAAAMPAAGVEIAIFRPPGLADARSGERAPSGLGPDATVAQRADPRIVAAAPRRPRSAASPLKLVIAGGIVAALLGARPLLAWTEALPRAGVLQRAAGIWHETMARARLTAPEAALRRAIRGLQAQRFAAPQDRQR